MTNDPFSRDLKVAYRRLNELAKEGRALPADYRLVLDDALQKLSTALEELQVTGEELREQNEEMLDLQVRLEEQRRRYEDLFEFAPDGYLVTDPDGLILQANQVAARLLNAQVQYLVEKPLGSYVAPWDRDRFYIRLEQLAQAQVDEWELDLLPRRQRPFPAALTVAPDLDGDGRMVRLRWLVRDISDSRRADERERLLAEVALERARFEAVIQNAPEGIVVADHEGRILLTNPAGEAISGRPLPHGQPYESHGELGFCYPDGTSYDPRDLPLTRSALDGEATTDLEMAVVWPDGRRRDLLVNSAPIRDALGEVTGAVAIFQDITERNRVRRSSRRYAQRLEVLHQVDAAILAAGSVHEIAAAVLPGVGRLLPCPWAGISLFHPGPPLGEDQVLHLTRDGRAERVPLASYGSLEELRQGGPRLVADVAAADATPAGLPLREELLALGAQALLTLPLIADEELIGTLDLALSAPGQPDEEQLEVARELANQLAIGLRQALLRGQVERYTHSLERSVAHRTAALQASEARFRTIFEDAALGIALVDENERILASNPALQEMLGYGAQELEGGTFLDFTHPDDVRNSHELYQELFSGKLQEYQIEKRYLRKDGTVLWVRPTVSLIRNLEGEEHYAIKMVEDITEQKRSQEALIQAERMSLAGQLGASLAHEINNPLQAVIGCLGLAEESLAEENLAQGDGVERYLAVAREELQRAARIVARLRDLHRRSDPDDREPTDLAALIDEVLLLLKRRFENRKIEVTWDPPPRLPHLSLVSDRIRQVFLNLILNAIDALPQGGHLLIEAAVIPGPDGEPMGVEVSFADDGPGLSAEARQRLFAPFYTTKPEGLGLGLYISHRIVAEHQGQIEVESQPGEGTRVTVRLPGQMDDPD
jgi:two-component system, sporulation sensor kinase C